MFYQIVGWDKSREMEKKIHWCFGVDYLMEWKMKNLSKQRIVKWHRIWLDKSIITLESIWFTVQFSVGQLVFWVSAFLTQV